MPEIEQITEAAPFGFTPDGTPRKSGYFAIIGDSPKCEPGDHQTAFAYLAKINEAIAQGGWTAFESTRLRKLRAKWARRALGKDARFNLVGTRGGRLTADVEYSLGRGLHGRGSKRDRPHPHFVDAEERRTTGGRKAISDAQDQAWADLDLPPDKARGAGSSPDSDDVSVFEPEVGELDLPNIPAARQYLIPGQDAKGHAQRIYCRVMPAHYRALCAIERSKVFGFRTVGDVLRWCVDLGARELNRRAHIPQVKSALAQMDAIREVLLDEQYYLEFPTLFELMTSTINRHLSAGAETEAIRLIATVRHEIEQMGEPYWRDKFMGELMRHYGTYLDGSRSNGVEFGGSE